MCNFVSLCGKHIPNHDRARINNGVVFMVFFGGGGAGGNVFVHSQILL